mgnify:FL=1
MLFRWKKNIIIDCIPKIFIPQNISSRIIGYELSDNFEANITDFDKEVFSIKKANKLYIRNKYELYNINANNIFVVNKNKMKFFEKRKKINIKIINLLMLVLISLFLTLLSFCYTNKLLDMKMYLSYFEPRLFLLNFIPIFLIVTFIYLLTNRIHIAFLVNSILILMLGVANQTKVLYRDDVVKFSDLLLLKEAITMSKRYDIVIKKYTILAIILVILVFLLLKRYIPKRKIKNTCIR